MGISKKKEGSDIKFISPFYNHGTKGYEKMLNNLVFNVEYKILNQVLKFIRKSVK